MTELERLAARFRSSLDCYRSAVAAVERYALIARPDTVEPNRRELQRLQQELGPDVARETLERTRDTFTRVMQEYGQQAGAQVRQQEEELREILSMVEQTADALAARNVLYNKKFQNVTSELETASVIDDPSRMHSRLQGVLKNLKVTVESLWSESQSSVSQMQTEVRGFHERLKQAEALATTDPVTSLQNRRAAEDCIQEEIRSGHPFCLVVADLNRFKSINDRFGHACGDQVLSRFASGLRGIFRADDAIYRWGGDEFVVVMKGRLSEIRQTLRSGGTLRVSVPVTVAGKQITLSISAAIGVAEYQPGEKADELFARADAGMYVEKSAQGDEELIAK